MANTYVDYTGNGTQDTYSITFPYLSNSHVTVQVGGVTQTEATHYNITTGNVVFTSGNIPANSAAIRIKRVTERVTPLVDFKDGSTLLEADLDTANLQSFYIAQETDESAFQADSDGNYDASNNKLVNVGTPTASTDGATKGYVDTQVASKDALSELSGDLDDIAAGTTNKHFTATDETKLDGIETGAEVNVNADWDATTGDAQILNKPGNATTSADGLMSSSDKTKLDGVAAGAEVNVQSDWDASSGDAQILNKPTVPTNLADLSDVSSSSPSDGQVLKWSASGSTWEAGNDLTGSGGSGGATTFIGLSDTPSSFTANKWLKVNSAGNALEEVDAPTGISNVADDATPQLGGPLDTNGQDIVSASSADIEIAPDGTGKTVFKGNTNAGTITLNCENNSHGVSVASPANADYSGNWTLTLPTSAGSNGQVLSTNGSGVASWSTLATYAATGNNSDITQLSGLTTAIAVSQGGTGATDASTARTNLGLGAAAEKDFDTAGGVQAYDADTTKNDVSNSWTAAQQGNTQTAAFSALSSGVLDFDTYQNFVITLGSGTNTFTNPTADAGNTGQTGTIVLIQPSSGAAGTMAVTASGDYKPVGGAAPSLSSTNSAVDIIPYMIQADNTILLGAPQLDLKATS
jgi:hypothetical protein